MNFEKYTTQELEFITSNVELLKKELQKRRIKELNKFPFEAGDVIHTRNNYNCNYFIKINEIDVRNNEVSVDEIVIRKNGLFEVNDGERWGIDEAEWFDYTKIEDPTIFENLLNITNKYYDDVQQLNDDTCQKLKNEIEHYE